MKFKGKFLNEKGAEVAKTFYAPNEVVLLEHLKKKGWQPLNYQARRILADSFFSFRRIETRDEALNVLKDIGIAYYVVGLLHFILGPVIGWLPHIDGGMSFLVVGYAIRNFQSRAAACVLLIGAFAFILLDLPRQVLGGNIGKNIIVIILLIRAIQASFSYHQIVGSKIVGEHVVIKSVLSLVYGGLFFFLTMVVMTFFESYYARISADAWLLIASLPIILGISMAFRGWLPLTRNKPLCVVEQKVF